MRWIIRPGIGLSDLLFGSSRDVVRSRLGEPEDVDEDLLGADPTVTWHYEEIGLTAQFVGEEDFRLLSLQTVREDAELCGHRLVGRPEIRVRSLLGQMGFGPALFELLEFSDHPSLGWLRYDEHMLGFWFEGGRLESIDWYPRIGQDDEYIWPEVAI